MLISYWVSTVRVGHFQLKYKTRSLKKKKLSHFGG